MGSKRKPTDPGSLSHVPADGSARMVDVGAKKVTRRSAVAEAWVEVGGEIADAIRTAGSVAKGSVLETARLAGILAAKRTAELIPLCHPIPIDSISVDAALDGHRVRIVARVASEGKTGVEMEALTAAAVASLVIYDMVKSAAKGVSIGPIRLLEKRGGKSGSWTRKEAERG
jgi:cyclic pyranopterin phosphate synthase